MMRVLHYIPGFNTGGIESVYLNWYKQIDTSKIEFELLVRSYDSESPMLKEYLELGGKIHTLKTPSLNLNTMYSFRQEVKTFFEGHHDYDFLHVHVPDDPFIISVAKKSGIPHIGVHAHTIGYNVSYKNQGIKGLIRKRNIKQAQHYFACSHQAAEWMFPDESTVEIIHNGIKGNLYEYNLKTREKYREELLLKDAFTIIHVGRFSEVKNHEFMLKIFENLKQTDLNCKLIFVGDGPLYTEMKQQVTADDILFLGARSDIPELLQAADVFLLPSKFEGLGIAAIEAQAAGLPTLVADRVPKEVQITNLVKFLPIDDDSIEKWVKSIVSLKEKSLNRRSTLSNLAENHYEIKQTTDDLISYYRENINH